MPKNLRFWSNVGLIAAAHVLVIVGLIRWSRASSNTSAQSVVWLNGGAGDGVVIEKKNLVPAMKSPGFTLSQCSSSSPVHSSSAPPLIM